MAKRTGAAVQAKNPSPEGAKEEKKRERAVKDAPVAIPVVPKEAEKPYWEEYGACLSDLLAPCWEMTFSGDDIEGTYLEGEKLKEFRSGCKKRGIKVPKNFVGCPETAKICNIGIDVSKALDRIQDVISEAQNWAGYWDGKRGHGALEYEDACSSVAVLKGAAAYLLRLSTDLNRQLADIKL